MKTIAIEVNTREIRRNRIKKQLGTNKIRSAWSKEQDRKARENKKARGF